MIWIVYFVNYLIRSIWLSIRFRRDHVPKIIPTVIKNKHHYAYRLLDYYYVHVPYTIHKCDRYFSLSYAIWYQRLDEILYFRFAVLVYAFDALYSVFLFTNIGPNSFSVEIQRNFAFKSMEDYFHSNIKLSSQMRIYFSGVDVYQ